MNITEIIDFLESNGLTEVENVFSEDEYVVVKYYYDFDKEEISAARSYANEESDVEEESEEWYRDYYLSYLLDVAKDNVSDILEDANEEFELSSMFKIVEGEATNNDYVKFIAVLAAESFDGDLDDVLSEHN